MTRFPKPASLSRRASFADLEPGGDSRCGRVSLPPSQWRTCGDKGTAACRPGAVPPARHQRADVLPVEAAVLGSGHCPAGRGSQAEAGRSRSDAGQAGPEEALENTPGSAGLSKVASVSLRGDGNYAEQASQLDVPRQSSSRTTCCFEWARASGRLRHDRSSTRRRQFFLSRRTRTT